MAKLVKQFCTKKQPFIPANAHENEYWEHIDAYEVDPDYQGEIILFHCPNCGTDFTVDFR